MLIFDTTDFRKLVGMRAPADLSAGRAEWQAWLDGGIYGVCVERHHTGVTAWDDNTITAVSQWCAVEDVWGLLGHASAAKYAHELRRECAG